MPNFGVWEWIVILVIILTIFTLAAVVIGLLTGRLLRNLKITVRIEKDEEDDEHGK
jgi:Sec-independent protein translocase protein TatA